MAVQVNYIADCACFVDILYEFVNELDLAT